MRYTETASATFMSAIGRRLIDYPFERVSSYKVRECRNLLRHECDVVASIAQSLIRGPGNTYGSQLLGCTEGDKALRLRCVPSIIARQLGYDLIPAIEALTLEGVHPADVAAFTASIRRAVKQLIADCDAIQTQTTQSVRGDYAGPRKGTSGTQRLCKEALAIADAAVAFCEARGVL